MSLDPKYIENRGAKDNFKKTKPVITNSPFFKKLSKSFIPCSSFLSDRMSAWSMSTLIFQVYLQRLILVQKKSNNFTNLMLTTC